ncbi:LysR substrate-binding domain-containing protein [Xylophilus sp.]|uniref:LysR substrate-binding domain-containing protein n=1 Tax=Xylophilus sp. TaxID=2653893 RepID=UPI0013B95FD1|nr:LysR substrate-binding domain-containing protein [Xylophilus sp.]KAF1048725.1 MAG: HTH-type transcriptional regulator CysL [Xylophilus sp.]
MPPTPTFDLELLRTFVAVVSTGTFAAAGAQQGRSQSAVTQQMQRLEQLLGQALFQKEGRNKHLTEQGRHLLRYAREILLLNDDAMASLRSESDGGSLRVGAPHDISDTLLPPLLSYLGRFLPRLRLELIVARSPQLMASLHRGELDLAVSNREDATLEGVVMRTSRTVWLCSAQYVHQPDQPLPLVLGDEPSIFRRYALEALDRHHIPWRTAFVSNSPVGVRAAVRAGLGITPRSLELLGPELRVLDEHDRLPTLPSITYCLWMRPHSVNPLVRQAFGLLKTGLGLHEVAPVGRNIG